MKLSEKLTAALILLPAFLAIVAGCARKPEELPVPEDRANGAGTFESNLREPWKGDLDAILNNRRVIRVLVSYSKTNFAVVQGHPQGLEYELLHRYETFLNSKVKRHKIKPLVLFIAVPREQLIPLLIEGRGDMAAGLAITPEREKLAAFTIPYIKEVRHVIVTGKDVGRLHAIDDCQEER
jgi:membrane-bound lytic murein transglycosylase MltF